MQGPPIGNKGGFASAMSDERHDNNNDDDEDDDNWTTTYFTTVSLQGYRFVTEIITAWYLKIIIEILKVQNFINYTYKTRRENKSKHSLMDLYP